MEIAKLTAEPRKTGGTRAAKRIRRQGKVPGIIYGHGLAPEPVTVDRKELETAIEHGAQVINLGLPNASHSVLVKDLQFDSVGLLPTHVDFIRVDLNERVTVSVPLEFRGSPIGIQEGGVFVEQIVDLEVETLVTQIPSSLRVNVADMKLGDFLHVSDIPMPPDVKAVTPGDAIVCSVKAKLAEVIETAPTEGEEPVQPEIITAKKPEEGAEE